MDEMDVNVEQARGGYVKSNSQAVRNGRKVVHLRSKVREREEGEKMSMKEKEMMDQ